MVLKESSAKHSRNTDHLSIIQTFPEKKRWNTPQVSIILIPKPTKTTQKRNYYRVVSVMNKDVKKFF